MRFEARLSTTEKRPRASAPGKLGERTEVGQDASARRLAAELQRPSSRTPRVGRDGRTVKPVQAQSATATAAQTCAGPTTLPFAVEDWAQEQRNALETCVPQASERLECLFARGVVAPTHYSGKGAAEIGVRPTAKALPSTANATSTRHRRDVLADVAWLREPYTHRQTCRHNSMKAELKVV